MGQATVHDLKDNDLVILATDGIFDNIEEKSILDIAGVVDFSSLSNVQKCLDDLAMRICRQAVLNSLDTKWESPFAKTAKSFGFKFQGGYDKIIYM